MTGEGRDKGDSTMQEEHLENTLSSLLPAQPPSPASPSQTAGEEGSTEEKGQTDSTVLLGMGFWDIVS